MPQPATPRVDTVGDISSSSSIPLKFLVKAGGHCLARPG